MSVCIRLSRYGRIHRPYFRIVAIDRRCHREGTASEIIGSYDPLLPDKNIQVKMDRVEAWVNQGALISPRLVNLLKFHGYQLPAKPAKAEKKVEAKKAKPAPKKGEKQPWVAPSRRAVKKHQAKLKAARKAEAAAKAPAETPAEAPKA